MRSINVSLITQYFVHKFGNYIPLTRINTVSRWIDKDTKSILDVGCGRGYTMLFLNRKNRFYTTGVDIEKERLDNAGKLNSHDEYLLCDIRNAPFPERSYDTIICLELIEHLEKEDGLLLLHRLEQVAKKQVIISTPIGFLKNKGIAGEAKSIHISGWNVKELKELGYSIRGNRLSIERLFLQFFDFHARKLILFNTIFWLFLSVLLSPLPYFFPNRFALDMVCIKQLDKVQVNVV